MTAEDILANIKQTYPHWCDKGVPSQEENEELCKRIQAGDKEAETELICKNVMLAYKMYQKYYRGEWEEDAFLGALMQLIVAAKRYDSSAAAFSTYATIWIRQFVQREIYDAELSVRLPSHATNSLKRIKRYLSKKEEGFNTSPITVEEIVELADVSEDVAINIIPFLTTMTSLDREVMPASGNSNDFSTISDFIVDEHVNIEDQATTKVFADWLNNLMKDSLSEKEYEVLQKRFGLLDSKVWTLEEIARSFNPPVTRERIRQIECRAIKKIRYNRKIHGYIKQEFSELLHK